MTRRCLVFAILFAALLPGCSTSPTQPIIFVPLSSFAIAPSFDTLAVGQSRTFAVSAVDTGGAVVTHPAVRWSSSNQAVFTVNAAGTARGVNEGSALLIASSGGLSDTALVIVLPTTRGWFGQSSGTSFNLNGIYAAADGNHAWAAGDGGRIQATTDAGRTWVAEVSGSSFALHGVWFTSDHEGWVVGGAGTVLHTTNGGASWTRPVSGTSELLYDVVFATPDTGWVVGTNGAILRTFDHGASWTRVTPTASTLRSVSFAGTRDGWAVGDGGVIVGTHDRGLTWFIAQPSVTIQPLRAVWRHSLTEAIAVGSQGVAPRTVTTPDSVRWQPVSAGSGNQLEGVCQPTDDVAYAVGLNGSGAILRTDNAGQSWTPQAAGTQFRLNDVFFIDGQRGWAVGANGTILHTVTGGLH